MQAAVSVGITAEDFVKLIEPELAKAKEIVASGEGALEFSLDLEQNNPNQDPVIERIDFSNDDMEDRPEMKGRVLGDWYEV